MKKILTILIAAAMLAAPAAASAAPYAEAASVSDTDAMTQALLTVKSRVDVPQELTEFESSRSDYTGIDYYTFRWSAKDGSGYINVNADKNGRIIDYYYYKNSGKASSGLLPLSRDEMRAQAEGYIAKLAPETVADSNDAIVFDSLFANESGYSASFKRLKNGIPVYADGANVNIGFSGDEVTNVNISMAYDYDAQFEAEAEEINDAAAAYRTQFPEEMVYQKERRYRIFMPQPNEDEIKLVYRIDNGGYISAYTGEKLERKSKPGIMARNEASMDMSGASAKAGGGLTPQEAAELDNIAGLYTADEAESFLRSLPELGLTDDMKRQGSSVSHSWRNKDDYDLSLNLGNEDYSKGNLDAEFDASNARLTYLANYRGYDEKNETDTDEKKAKANALIDSFLSKVTDKLSEFELTSSDEYVGREYRRIVNGVPYVDNTLSVSANAEYIDSYILYYDNDPQLTSPSQAMSSDDGYAKLLEAAPLEKQYIKTENGYRLAYSRDSHITVDAITGEAIGAQNTYNASASEYDDIKGHWCEEAVNALRDNGIAFEGSRFRPDDAISQADILRLFMSGQSRYNMTSDEDALYRSAFAIGILNEQEKAPLAFVARENAFKYLVRMLGYDEVARLSDIYKVTYADGDKLTDGALGYAAILSGMGIIEGDGEILRPDDNITRAEAAMMLYRYMKK